MAGPADAKQGVDLNNADPAEFLENGKNGDDQADALLVCLLPLGVATPVAGGGEVDGGTTGEKAPVCVTNKANSCTPQMTRSGKTCRCIGVRALSNGASMLVVCRSASAGPSCFTSNEEASATKQC